MNKINDLDYQRLKKYIKDLSCSWIEDTRIIHNHENPQNCIIKVNEKKINLANIGYFEGLEKEEGILVDFYAWKYNFDTDLKPKLMFELDRVDFSRCI
jgi:hypothetical protein